MKRTSCLGAVSVALALTLGLSLAAPAGARKFQMSGSWVVREGGIFLPLQFAVVDPGPPHTYVSMGELTNALGHPNGPIPGRGVVTATGSSPATLRVPRHRFAEDAMTVWAFNDPTLIQIGTSFGIDGPYATATLAAGLGPGSFTWCPRDPACVAGGGMRSTDPPQGAGNRNGRVIYRAGANQFGGAMQMGLRRGLIVSVLRSPMRVVHLGFRGAGGALHRLAPGGLGAPDAPVTEKAYLLRAFVTQPTMFPPMGSPILYPGPKVTTMFGTTLMGLGMVFYPNPVIATGPMGTKASQFHTAYGFAHTTGTVFAQQSMGSGGDSFFTAMGSDARTPLGAGNISLVTGGLTFNNNRVNPPPYDTPFATFQKVTLTLAPPTPSLSPAGLAASGGLVLLAAGYALRGRLAAPRRRG